MTVIRSLGHAGLYVRTPGAAILIDPWFSDRGAFLASWHQFPRNDHLELDELREVDHVLLSHEHRDHFDIDFLQTLRADTTIVIPKFTDDYLRRELREELPNEVVVLPSHQSVDLGEDLRVTPVVQSVPIWDDCAFVVQTPRGTILDVNDMKLSAKDMEWIRRSFTVDHLFMQFSGANWHPHIYGHDPERKRQISKHKRENKFASVHHALRASGAGWLVPMAGPPCFLDPEHFDLNFEADSIFPDLADFHRYACEQGFDDRTIILLPGDDLLDDEDHPAANRERLRAECFADKQRYLTRYQSDRLPTIEAELAAVPRPTEPLLPALQSYFQPLITAAPHLRKKIDGRLLLEVTRGEEIEEVVVDFTRSKDSVYARPGEHCFYTLRIEARFLNLVLQRQLSWEELLLSLRLQARRDPDQYNEHLIVFLRFADPESYRAYARYERRKQLDERTVIVDGDATYEISRYCPHGMADLSNGQIVDGAVVCPGHGWAFRLADGACTTNPASIAVRELAHEMRCAP